MKNALLIFDMMHPDCVAIFTFDNSQNHKSDHALIALAFTDFRVVAFGQVKFAKTITLRIEVNIVLMTPQARPCVIVSCTK